MRIHRLDSHLAQVAHNIPWFACTFIYGIFNLKSLFTSFTEKPHQNSFFTTHSLSQRPTPTTETNEMCRQTTSNHWSVTLHSYVQSDTNSCHPSLVTHHTCLPLINYTPKFPDLIIIHHACVDLINFTPRVRRPN